MYPQILRRHPQCHLPSQEVATFVWALNRLQWLPSEHHFAVQLSRWLQHHSIDLSPRHHVTLLYSTARLMREQQQSEPPLLLQQPASLQGKAKQQTEQLHVLAGLVLQHSVPLLPYSNSQALANIVSGAAAFGGPSLPHDFSAGDQSASLSVLKMSWPDFKSDCCKSVTFRLSLK